MMTITEAGVEAVALDWLAGVGWQVADGRNIALDTPNAERRLRSGHPGASAAGSPLRSELRPPRKQNG